jgi:hypothetical protein
MIRKLPLIFMIAAAPVIAALPAAPATASVRPALTCRAEYSCLEDFYSTAADTTLVGFIRIGCVGKPTVSGDTDTPYTTLIESSCTQ